MNVRPRYLFPLAVVALPASLPSPRRMNRLLLLAGLAVLPLLAACASFSKSAGNTPNSVTESSVFALSTTELETRRAALKAEIASIEREVEMKAGLHMAVGISDERGRLSGLYREASSIERELLRRASYSKL
jgi:uncharacterized small protein (DUF1192 family)